MSDSPEALLRPCLLVPAIGIALLMAALIAARMRALTRHDQFPPAPSQVSLALAWTPHKSENLMKAWKESGCKLVRSQVNLDFALILVYVLGGVAASIAAGHAFQDHASSLAALASVVSGLWIAAGVLDVAENLILLHILPPDEHPAWQPAASVCASLKFVLIAVAAAYPVVALTAAALT